MRVDVLRVLDPSRGIVFFGCAVGSALGRWMGELPVQPGSYEVEIEVPDEVVGWVAATSGTTSLSGAPEPGSSVRIECEVERFDDGDDAVVEARLGSGVLLVEILGRRPDLRVGALISFQVPKVQLYPYDG